MALTKNERNRIERDIKSFMGKVVDFLTIKGGGSMPAEWQLSVDLLETYYRQFLQASTQIAGLEEMTVDTGRGGVKEHPLFTLRDKASIRIEGLLKQMGLTLKTAKDLNVVDVKEKPSALDEFLKHQNAKGVELR